jgi:transposase
MTKKKAKPVFKQYTMGQIALLPRDLEEEIEPNHLVRVVNAAIEKMDLKGLYAQYQGGGTSSYHPKMLLKVLVYGYTQQIYSSRKIAKALRENIHFMWLSGNNHPDFHTINRFRGVVVKGSIGEIFAAVLTLLIEGGHVKLENYFVDGTKVEANANKYSFVWAKNTKRYKEQLQTKVGELLEKIEEINASEDAEYGENDLEERGGAEPIDAARLEEKINELNERLRKMQSEEKVGAELVEQEMGQVETPPKAEPDEPTAKPKGEKCKRQKSKVQQLSRSIQQLEKECLSRLQDYEMQEKTLAGRNSYAKTDHDATFMRMKEDHMQNGQLKAGYNVQTGTEDQFVVGFSVHQRPGDPGCLVPHLKQVKQQLGRLPENIIADSAYGSEENYAYLEQEQIAGNYLKYNTFHQEQKPRYKPNPFAADQMPYDEAQNIFTCPNGKKLNYRATHRSCSENGFESQRQIYECEDCSQCPLKEKCTKAAGNRQIKISFRLKNFRAQACQNLCSEKGKKLRAQRSIDVETVFGRIKQDWGFRRFMLRGLEKVKTEWGLLCIAHNFAKMAVA